MRLPWETFVDEALEAVADSALAHRAWPPAEPLPRQREIIDECVAAARRAGLQLPSRVDVRWVVADPLREFTGRVIGCAGQVVVELNVNMAPLELHRVVYHELQHVADLDDPSAVPAQRRGARTSSDRLRESHDGGLPLMAVDISNGAQRAAHRGRP